MRPVTSTLLLLLAMTAQNKGFCREKLCLYDAQAHAVPLPYQ